MNNLKTLLEDLRRLGVNAGDKPLLVHSAIKAVGPIDGRADALIEALLVAVGPSGTLLFPNLNIPHQFDATNPPRFDLQKDPIRVKLGILPQRFKETQARYFSRHPTHAMMGVGSACRALFVGHENAGIPCGAGTPWWRLAEAGGSILLLGVTQKSNTSIHGPEEMYASYQLSRDPIRGVAVDDGLELAIDSRLHVWGNRSDFSRVDPWLEKAGGLRRGTIGGAKCLLIDATIFQAEVSRQLQENPRFLLL